MAKITLTSIEWSSDPEEPKVVQIAYLDKSQPDDDANYTIASTNSLVDVNGEFLPEFVINGLDPNKDYIVRVVSLCGGYFAKVDFSMHSSDDAAFSYGFSLGFQS